jgi:hypothetical protein
MLLAQVNLRFYDADNALIGQTVLDLPITSPVVSGDTGAFSTPAFSVQTTEPATAVTRIECRPATATFSGNKRWAYGTTWPEPLLPLPTPPPAASSQSSTSASTGARSPLGLVVNRAWNDVFPNSILVHAALTITGAETPQTLHPSDLTLTMKLSSGAMKSYTAVSRAAPTYQKLNAVTGATMTAYEVDPKDDLGRLGEIIIPAHGTVNVVATFWVQESVADPTDNKNVTLK